MKNFLQFSQTITRLTEKETAWFATYIEHRHRGLDFDGNELNLDEQEVYPNFGFRIIVSETELGTYAWFYSKENGSVEQVAETVQEFLKKNRPDDCFSMTWSELSDNLTPEEFDGGGVFVTAEEIETFHAVEWVCLKEEEFRARRRARLQARERVPA